MVSHRVLSILSIGFSILVICIVCLLTFSEETIRLIITFNIWFLLLAIAFRIIALLFWGVRIKLMARSLDYRVPFFNCVNMVLAGLFAGAFTPGQIGGEPVRVHELYRTGVKVGDATTIVIMERVLDGIILTILGIVTLIMLGDIWTTFPPSVQIIIVIAWVFMLSILIIPFAAIRYPERTKSGIMRFVFWLAAKFPGKRMAKIRDGTVAEYDNFVTSVTLFTGPASHGLIWGGLATFAFWIAEFMVASILLMGLGYPPSIAMSFFFQIIIAIIMMIPLTPGASGVTEISTTTLYALLIPASAIGIFVLVWRFVTFYLNLILGGIASMVICREMVLKSGPAENENE